jgi:hypothetical protein
MNSATRIGIQANIANFVRQEIRVPISRPLLPVFEAVSNSLDAIADRDGGGEIRVTVLRDGDLLEGKRGSPHTFVVEDDGVGFNDENIAGFDELYSARKAHQGGKGRGRFTYLKVFQNVEINSTFQVGDDLKTREFTFNLSYVGYKGKPRDGGNKIGTKVTLSGMSPDYAAKIPRETTTLIRDFVSHFLPVILSDRKVEIILNDGKDINLTDFVRQELLVEEPKREPFSVGARNFSILSVKFKPISSLHHRLILAAAAREVRGTSLEKLIPVLTSGPLDLDKESGGFFFIAIIEGKFLDEAVDPMRVAFTDEQDDTANGDEVSEDDALEEVSASRGDLFGEPQSIGQIRKEAIKIVRGQLRPYIQAAIDARSNAIEKYICKDGMGYHFLKGEIPELAKNLRAVDDKSIETHLSAAAYIERKKRSQRANELLSATPKEKSEETYLKKWTEIVDSLGDVAKSDLANYVTHRRVILDLIEDVIMSTEEGSYRREEVIHSIVFPKGKQAGEVGKEQQNLWMIDERLAFHEHLYSDLTIKRITRGEVPAAERPDLAIYESGFASFHDGGKPPATLVLVELKQPGRTNASQDDPVSKTLLYVEKLKSGHAKTEGGAVIDIEANALTTVYILADWTADFLRYLKREAFKAMPGDVGRYMYREEEKIMFIAMSFSRLVESARRRNRVFFKRLGIEQ